MGRNKKEGDLKLDIREKNGKFYAYRSTSTSVNGVKKTETEYLGRYDPETQTVIEKRIRGPRRSKEEIEATKKEMTIIDLLKGVESREYGAVYLLDAIQRRTHLGCDLHLSFGTAAPAILASAMALAIEGGAFMHIEDTMDRSMIRQFYGLRSRFDSRSMSDFTHEIGLCNSNIDDFFGYRLRRCDSMISWDTTTKGTYSLESGLAEYAHSKDGERIPQIKKAMASDMRGVPTMFEMYPGTMSDMATLTAFVDRIRRYGRDDLVVAMDRGFGSGANLHHMNSLHVKYVVPANIGVKTIKSLMTEFHHRSNDRRVHDGHSYDVWETKVVLIPDCDKRNAMGDQVYSIIDGRDAPSDSEFVDVFVCFDTEKYSDETQSLRVMLDEISKKLDRIDAKNPMEEFKRIAGKAARYFEASAEGRHLRYRVKNNAVSFSENRAGMFVMLATPGIGWESMMSIYDARTLVEQNFDADKAEDRRFRTSDPVTIHGREFIRFISLVMRCEIAAQLRRCPDPVTVQGIINSMGAITSMGRGDEWIVKNVTKRNREMFEYLNIEVPQTVLLNQRIYTQEELDDAILTEAEASQ